ncbi:MAG: TylF/MycF/NovP-related O-methyltransferase [Betaproteobacteria bacterium]
MNFLKLSLLRLGINPRYIPIKDIPDAKLYAPLFSPWLARPYSEIRHTVVSPDRCYILHTLASQTTGPIVECGVYRGGTAMLLSTLKRELHLYDTFEGMPETGTMDIHKRGDFSDTSVEAVRKLVPSAFFHKGLIPETFTDLPGEIGFAHIDVDIYKSVKDCCEHLYPRLTGFMVFDDYGFPSCPGARRAVDEFFNDKPEKPVVIPTGQAIIFKRK